MNKIKKGSLISRLLSQKDKLKQKNKNLITENKKLNNAFDDLEKYLINLINNDGISIEATEVYEDVLDKLNELRSK